MYIFVVVATGLHDGDPDVIPEEEWAMGNTNSVALYTSNVLTIKI